MNKEINGVKVDYENILADVKWDMDKAKFLLEKLHDHFECADLDYPPRKTIDTIRYEFKSIAININLLEDLVRKVSDTIAPLI